MKKILFLFLSLSLLFSLSACQQTPEEALVVQKDKDRLESMAAETASEENSLKFLKETTPEAYTYNYSDNAAVTITAKASLNLPETDRLTAHSISGGYLSQEFVTNIYNYLFQGKKTYDITGTDFTKDDCEAEILKLKQDLAQVEASDEFPDDEKQSIIDGTQSLIAKLEKEYENLPEESTLKKIEVDSTLRKSEESTTAGQEEYYIYCETENGAYLSADSCPATSAGRSRIYYGLGSKVHYSLGEGTSVTEEEARSEMADTIGISYDEAKKLADGLFQAVGIEARLTQISLEKGYSWESLDSNPYTDNSQIAWDDDYSAFCFVYSRVIDGANVAITNLCNFSGDSNFSVSWNDEIITIVVSKNGIEEMNWDTPISIDEKISDNVGLLSFEKASSIFEKMVPTVYLGRFENEPDSVEKYHIDITSVELSLMRVRNSGNERSGLLVPAWVFYGDWQDKLKSTDEWDTISDPPYIVLAVNAVDGTVIDPNENY